MPYRWSRTNKRAFSPATHSPQAVIPIGVKRHEKHPPVVGGSGRSLEGLTESHSDFPYFDAVDFQCIILTRGGTPGRAYAAGRCP